MPHPLPQLLLALAWILFVEAMAFAGMATFAALTGGRMRACDLAPARTVAIFGLALVVWLGRSEAAPATISALVLVTLTALALLARAPSPERGAPFPDGPRDWVMAEACYLVPFAIFLTLRGRMPQLEGAEKLPDFAFFLAMPLAGSYPAPDPWLSGHAINYYSFGHLALALPGHWLDVAPEVAYHIALAFVGGAAFATVASILRDVTGRWIWGILGGWLTVFAGNLDGLKQLVGADGLGHFDYWRSSRVIPNAIDEFPFFSLLHGDLHAHLIAILPQTLLLTACVRLARAPVRNDWLPDRPALLAAFALGTGWVTNPWDVPILATLVFGSLVAAAWHRAPGLPRSLAVARASVTGFLPIVAGYSLYLPFHLSYRPPVEGLRVYQGASPLGAYLVHLAPLLLPVAVLFASEVLRLTVRGSHAADKLATLVTGTLAASFLFFLVSRRPVVALNLPLIAAALLIGARREDRALPALLFSVALFFLTLCEWVHVGDPYQPPLERMNTVFKIYSGAWPLLAVAATLALSALAADAGRPMGWLATGIAFSLLAPTFIYPALAPRAAAARASLGHWSLDGLAEFARTEPDEYAAVQWLRALESRCPRSVLLEASGDPYSLHARLASYSGVPDVLGWANHEMVWRGSAETQEILDRQEAIAGIYESGDMRVARPLIDRYEVSLVAIGSIERREYPAAALAVLEKSLPRVFRSGEVTILAVPGKECP